MFVCMLVHTLCVSNIQQSKFSYKHIQYIWRKKIDENPLWNLINVSVFSFKSHTHTLKFIDVVAVGYTMFKDKEDAEWKQRRNEKCVFWTGIISSENILAS